MKVLGKVYSPASVPPWPNTAGVRGHAPVRHQSGGLVPLSDALGLRSVAVVRIEVMEVCAFRHEAGRVTVSVKSGQGRRDVNSRLTKGLSARVSERRE